MRNERPIPRPLALLILLVLLVLVPGTFHLALPAAGSPTPPAEVVCIAHRGGNAWLPAHTEQTEDTFAAAIAAGVPEVEGDIRFTSTGYPYLLHDANLGLFAHPTTALATITGTTAAGPTYTSTTGDKLWSLYGLRQQLVASPATRLQAELKTVPTEAQWAMLANRLDPIKDRTTLTSFNRDMVQAAQVRGYRTGLLSATFDETTEAPIFAQQFASVEPDDVDIHRRRGVTTQTWTIDTPADWASAAGAGVTGIITNRPAECMAWAAGGPTTPPVSTTAARRR